MGTWSYGADYDPDEGSELRYDSAGNPVTNAYLERLADELERDSELTDVRRGEFQVRVEPRDNL